MSFMLAEALFSLDESELGVFSDAEGADNSMVSDYFPTCSDSLSLSLSSNLESFANSCYNNTSTDGFLGSCDTHPAAEAVCQTALAKPAECRSGISDH